MMSRPRQESPLSCRPQALPHNLVKRARLSKIKQAEIAYYLTRRRVKHAKPIYAKPLN